MKVCQRNLGHQKFNVWRTQPNCFCTMGAISYLIPIWEPGTKWIEKDKDYRPICRRKKNKNGIHFNIFLNFFVAPKVQPWVLVPHGFRHTIPLSLARETKELAGKTDSIRVARVANKYSTWHQICQGTAQDRTQPSIDLDSVGNGKRGSSVTFKQITSSSVRKMWICVLAHKVDQNNWSPHSVYNRLGTSDLTCSHVGFVIWTRTEMTKRMFSKVPNIREKSRRMENRKHANFARNSQKPRHTNCHISGRWPAISSFVWRVLLQRLRPRLMRKERRTTLTQYDRKVPDITLNGQSPAFVSRPAQNSPSRKWPSQKKEMSKLCTCFCMVIKRTRGMQTSKNLDKAALFRAWTHGHK